MGDETHKVSRRDLLAGFAALPTVTALSGRLRELSEGAADEEEAARRSTEVLPEEAGERLCAAEEAVVALARTDPPTFCAYVLRDEETGGRIFNEPVHDLWHEFLSANRRAIIWGSVDSGKTSQIAVGRVLWELGRNPSLRVAIVSNTDMQAQKICRNIAKYIENSRELHAVFPHLRRAPGHPWTSHQLFVERPTRARDASVSTGGVHGNIIGSRFDLVIFDDILDYENTVSPAQRKDVEQWTRATVFGRLTKRARAWMLGMVWDAEDMMHSLARSGAWASMRSPVVDDDGVLQQPRRWPAWRVEEARGDMTPADFDRQIRCKTLAQAEKTPFKREWLDKCLARGANSRTAYAIRSLAPGERVYTGVDLGVRDKRDSAVTCLFTLLIHPNDDRQVLDVDAGHWDGPTIVDKIVDVHRRFSSLVFVENVAAQDFILQFARKQSAVPVRPFQTSGRGKAQVTNVNHPEWGFEAMAVEFYNGKWIVPSKGGVAREVQEWLSELMMWERGLHVGDRAMASWIAVQGSKYGRPRRSPGVRRRRMQFMRV